MKQIWKVSSEKVILAFALKDRSQVRRVRDKINEKGESVDLPSNPAKSAGRNRECLTDGTLRPRCRNVETSGTLYILQIFRVSEPEYEMQSHNMARQTEVTESQTLKHVVNHSKNVGLILKAIEKQRF